MPSAPRIDSHRHHTPVIEEDVWVDPSAVIIGEVRLRRRCNIWPGVVLRGDQGGIDIGEETSIQDGSIGHATLGRSVTKVGARCTVGHRVILHGCTVEDDCLIGMGAILLDGCVVGRGSIVAAGAVVPPDKEIPPGSMVVGVPGRVVRAVSAREHVEYIEHGRAEYLRLAAEYGGFPPLPGLGG
ncbi:MAG: gamma carbonic anhydrase family protein [Myxococcota bacterium]|nr:gamma carbonic anhydrase family protein [Myxococcota bacterium]